jgi:hypothetical protein
MNTIAKSILKKRNYFFILAVFMLFTLATGLLTIRSAADDKTQGSRNSGRVPKSQTTPSQRQGLNPEHPENQTLNLSPQAVPKPQPQVPRALLAVADFDLLGLAVTISPANQTVP